MLSKKFFLQSAYVLAKKLLGKKIVFNSLEGVIVETEAYLGFDDPGSHIYKGVTNRNKVMLEEGGTIYVYLCCGMYYMFNIVADKKNIPGAVLIRSVEPIAGIEKMKKNRKTDNIKNLTNGPGKFTKAFGINKDWNNKNIFTNKFYIESKDTIKNFEIVETTRIGIKEGSDLKLRFYIKDNPFVSIK